MKIPVTNSTAGTIWVGGQMIPPGETRHFEEHQVPRHFRPAPKKPKSEENAGEDPAAIRTRELTQVLNANVTAVRDYLPKLSDADIEELAALEEAGKQRKGVLEALAEEALNRASKKDGESGEGDGE